MRKADCSRFKNSYAKWDKKANEPRCFCKAGYEWNRNRTVCVPKAKEVIGKEDYRCKSYIALIKNKLRTGDTNNLKLLAKTARLSGCSDPAIDQVIGGDKKGDCPPGTVLQQAFGSGKCVKSKSKTTGGPITPGPVGAGPAEPRRYDEIGDRPFGQDFE